MIDIQLEELDLTLEVVELGELPTSLDSESTLQIQGPITFQPDLDSISLHYLDLDLLGFPYQGLSAYEIAVKNGFVGTEQEWLDSLKGKDGELGQGAKDAILRVESYAESALGAASAAAGYRASAETYADDAKVWARSSFETYTEAKAVRDGVADYAFAMTSIKQESEALLTDTLQLARATIEERVKAETARANAELVETRVALAKTTAEEAMASASHNATMAVEAFNKANDRANAAVIAEQTASSYANDAYVESNAANQSKIEAKAARDDALLYSQAVVLDAALVKSYAADAETWANASRDSKTAAESARDQSQGAAAAAISASEAANTYADSAGSYANAAKDSEVFAGIAKDQTLEAIGLMGRVNLASRANVTSGSPVTNFASPSLSGWGFTLTGRPTGGVERAIVVGPLKRATTYSISFKARRADSLSGPTPLSVDLHPDTLPERVFQISPEWEEYKWEGLTSNHVDMLLPTVRLRFFRSPLAEGLVIEVTDIKLEQGATATAWTPSPKDAEYHAQAAATFKSEAEVFKDAAGVSANAASNWATQAATDAGKSQTYMTQSSSSASAAEGYKNQAESYASNAQNYANSASLSMGAAVAAKDQAGQAASTAETHSVTAGNHASSAAISADLVAGFTNTSGFNLLKNSTFAYGLKGWYSDSWTVSSPTAPVGPHVFCSLNGTNGLRSDEFIVNARFNYTISADFRAQGTSGNVVIDLEWFNASGVHLGYSNRIFARVSDNVNFNQPRKSVTVTPPAGAVRAVLRVYTENVTDLPPGGAAVRQIKVEVGDKPTTWRDDTELLNQGAELGIVSSVMTDLQSQISEARFEATPKVGDNFAKLKVFADRSGSIAELVAQAISFANTVAGQTVEVMRLVAGSVFISGPLYIGPNKEIELNPISSHPHIAIKVGSGRMAFGRLPNDGLIYWFGSSQEVVNMRKNNATEWRDSSGSAYFGGSIIAGTISNSGHGSLLGVPASFTLGPFGTNGGPINIVWSYDYSRLGRRWGNQTGGVTGQTTALVRFYRKIGGAAETLIDSMTVTGNFNAYYEPEPVPGQPTGTIGQTIFTEYMGGSRTYTDNAGGTEQRTYRVEVVTRSLKYVPGDSNQSDAQSQKYGITSSE